MKSTWYQLLTKLRPLVLKFLKLWRSYTEKKNNRALWAPYGHLKLSAITSIDQLKEKVSLRYFERKNAQKILRTQPSLSEFSMFFLPWPILTGTKLCSQLFKAPQLWRCTRVGLWILTMKPTWCDNETKWAVPLLPFRVFKAKNEKLMTKLMNGYLLALNVLNNVG